MAAVWEGMIPSRRRPSRSHSESGKQLHARWGDATISAPNGGGWSQHYLDDDVDNVVYQAHGSPDSQKTLVNDSPNLSLKDDIDKISIEEFPQSSPPLVHKERGQITFTIPLPWSRKTHRRSSSVNKNQPHIVTPESQQALPSLTTSIDEVIIAESRPSADPCYRTVSPVTHAQSPIYDDVNTFFTRSIFPEKHPGTRSLPPLQTAVPINQSQPASALSILSPVAEKFNGMSESNNATPMDNTPIAHRIETALPPLPTLPVSYEYPNLSNLAERLEMYAHNALPMLPPSRIASPIDHPIDRPESRTSRYPSRPASRGPGIGEVAYMRASSREPGESHGGRRSASRDPTARRNPSKEPLHRRAVSREAARRRADSPRGMSGRSYSREDGTEKQASRAPSQAPSEVLRAPSRGTTPVPAEFLEARIGRDLSLDPLRPRAESPGPLRRRKHSRAPSARREKSPINFSRRAVSREAYTHHRISGGDFTRRAMSVDPIRRHASPRDETIHRHATPLGDFKFRESETESSSDDLTGDDTTDIDTETDEMYYKSRRGWNGPAAANGGKGFYHAVIDDYKLIGHSVEAEQTQLTPGKTPVLGFGAFEKREKKDVEVVHSTRYGGPELVPCHEDLWG